MSSAYLLDPAIVTSSAIWDIRQSSITIAWCNDPRARLGTASRSVIVDLLTKVQSSTASPAPRPIRTLFAAALSSLLSRAPFDAGRSPEALTFDPEYDGSPENRELLELDLHDHDLKSPVYVGTQGATWARVPRVGVLPGPLESVLILPKPGLPTEEDLIAARREYFHDAKILLVGGQVEQRILRALREEFDLSDRDTQWEPCEYNKPPRNLDDQISGLGVSGKSIVISITGKMGHSTSGKIKANCQRHHVDLIEVEGSASVLLELRSRADNAVPL